MANRPTVLVVDDDDAVLEATVRLLQHRGFNVIAESDPVKALAMVIEGGEHTDALVCDFQMPKINGEQLARAAKNRRPGLPVFVLSGTIPPDRQSVPWDGWYVKGTQMCQLIRELQTLLIPSRRQETCPAAGASNVG